MKVEQTKQTQNKSSLDFFTSSSSNNQVEKEKSQPQKEKIENKKVEKVEMKVEDKGGNIDEMIIEIEKKLNNVKELTLTDFNTIALSKKLIFKLLFIHKKIYLRVWNADKSRSTIIAVEPPKWGGSSLRFLITNCTNTECQVFEKNTNGKKVYAYKPLDSLDNIEDDIDDIFD